MSTNQKPDPVKTMVALANLAKVRESLAFLAEMGVVKEESIAKGCRKFVNDHPEIQQTLDAFGADNSPGM